ncbi:MAG TPA: hypothetical protein VM535_00085, partial [Candidatus Saccharimonadales bacterium]|nr:hypothetical protein [Candidatus Saccharimonadales bacterium]
MPENLGGGAEIPNIELPSALRIRQRLGMLAARQHWSYGQELVPSIAQLGGEAMTPDELVTSLETKTAAYAEANLLGMERFVQQGIPKIIDKIVDDPRQKTAALTVWDKVVDEKKAADAAADG